MTAENQTEMVIAVPDYLFGRVVARQSLSSEEVDQNKFEVSLPFAEMGPVPNQEHLLQAARSLTVHFEGTGYPSLESLKLTVSPNGVRGAERLKSKIVTIIISDPK